VIHDAVESLKGHYGEFLCELIGSGTENKIEKFIHKLSEPTATDNVSSSSEISEFFLKQGSALLYFCPESGDAAFHLANPTEWDELEEEFSEWIEMLDDDEKSDALPPWFGSHKVIGEIPSSGNYLLVVESGGELGSIYMFDHDGFEFYKLASSLSEFISTVIDPNPRFLSSMASHMRFVTDDNWHQQWWLKELRHNSGKVVVNVD